MLGGEGGKIENDNEGFTAKASSVKQNKTNGNPSNISQSPSFVAINIPAQLK